MKKLLHRLGWSGIIALVFMVLFALTSLALFPLFYHNHFALVQAKDWLNHSQMAFLIWRLSILFIIFISWPWFIRYRAKQRLWPVENIQKAISLRYYLVIFLLLLDVVFQWGLA